MAINESIAQQRQASREMSRSEVFSGLLNAFSLWAIDAMQGTEASTIAEAKKSQQKTTEPKQKTQQGLIIEGNTENLRDAITERFNRIAQTNSITGARSAGSNTQLVDVSGQPFRSTTEVPSSTELSKEPMNLDGISERINEMISSTPLLQSVDRIGEDDIVGTKLDIITGKLDKIAKALANTQTRGGGGILPVPASRGLLRGALKLGATAYAVGAAGDIAAGGSRMVTGDYGINEQGEMASGPGALALQTGVSAAVGYGGYRYAKRGIDRIRAAASPAAKRAAYMKRYKEFAQAAAGKSNAANAANWTRFTAYLRATQPALFRRVGGRLALLATLAAIPGPGWVAALVGIGLNASLAISLYDEYRKFMNLPEAEKSVWDRFKAGISKAIEFVSGSPKDVGSDTRKKMDKMPKGFNSDLGGMIPEEEEGEKPKNPEEMTEEEIRKDLSERMVAGSSMTSDFGRRENPLKPGEMQDHKGLDISTGKEDPINAPYEGTVYLTGENETRGRFVVLSHNNGQYYTGYNHLSASEDGIQVKVGDKIGKGQQIGKVGNTGASTGAHLHYEFMKADPNDKDPSDGIDYIQVDPVDAHKEMMELERQQMDQEQQPEEPKPKTPETRRQLLGNIPTPTEVMPEKSSVGPELRSAGGERQQQMMASAAPIVINNTPITNSPVIAPPPAQQKQKMPQIISTIDDVLPESARMNFNMDRWA